MVRPSIYRYAFFCLLRGEGSVFRISKEVGMILLNESVGDTYLPPSFLCCKRLEANSYRKNNVLYESSVLCRLLCGLLYDRWFFLFYHDLVSSSRFQVPHIVAIFSISFGSSTNAKASIVNGLHDL